VNRTGQLLALFGVMALLLALLVRGGGRGGRASGPDEGVLFPKATEQDARRVEISLKDGTTTILEKSGEVWNVATAGGYAADAVAVTKIFEVVGGLEASQLVSRSAEKHALYEVDSTAARVAIFGGGDQPVARFFVGKNGPDFQSSYVRPVDSEKVYLSTESLRQVFERGRRGWRDQKILSFAPEEVAGIRFLSTQDTVGLAKGPDGTWSVDGDSARIGQGPILDGVLRTLARYTADDFADTSIVADSVGLAPPERAIEVTLKAAPPQTLEIGRIKENRHYWVRLGGKRTIFLVVRGRVDTIWKTRSEVTAPKPEPAAVEAESNAPNGAPAGH